jgi:hypothetical protein
MAGRILPGFAVSKKLWIIDYADFLTPHSGLIQIKKYAEQENLDELLHLFSEITDSGKKVKDAIYKLLVVDFKYFE